MDGYVPAYAYAIKDKKIKKDLNPLLSEVEKKKSRDVFWRKILCHS